MTIVLWETQAQIDRKNIFLYLYREAGLPVASAADEKFIMLAGLLEDNPQAGVVAGKFGKHRKLTVARFPFIIVYVIEPGEVRILRILHTSRKIASRYRQ
ncbi:type II toxin-antitoxin system RelE/ParE family toxin [Limnobaculum zhutongyuii]|uniref:Type II toxin-antitoxin system RelE/ParE family toxin n=1 Tax=Limnobaculum zhutongyuii TaxID=2498113 RepID=A0A411WR36_9GAMM|nr:type II toxin-antitoxin system RelE/ParE family toxin [Limnobaculum zhutongyuii]QBH98475.1 type II toxin-antitoxin system RelE/ParE family toxin [Limnobaculum zhutongyuii]TQS90078.1 type II toxin-antitoxin system RelE/ParE family toxin [Limnobaculum zhutongyuii]